MVHDLHFDFDFSYSCRKSVSVFLTSGLREQIDRIMVSRSQQLPNARISHVEKPVSAQVAEDEEEEVEQNGKEEVEVEWGYNDDSEDDNIPSRPQYDEPEALILQNTSSQSWNTNPYQEVTDDSYHFPSPSSLQSQSSNIYSQPCSSSTGHPSTVSCLSLPDIVVNYEIRIISRYEIALH